ncbi:hypothetical protein CBJ62_13260 [Salmonella enterica subsp. enterica serovar Agoueve]|uniref:Uncharacterized protein n=1 Tax=Salmonella enterica subsp. enterica serovar Mapo TaxID=2564752 RepID=A0A5H7IL20_SALET|nr:hypothetical protein [Salmonella enterica]EAU1486397.1 hypothetical protein [Salmonella enterica]EBW2327670.1 hypothetical protein [Salmonella enterica subsp. enterica serovar Agoueve]ECD4528927.1 hypothetical protein [Salmonella enterica subsp. enterica serovar Mapo]OZU41781.1 hypothetical protein CCO53_03120 [Salmonella enterica subsp. enterica serovar Ekotedo]
MKQSPLFNYCDQKQQIFNNEKGEVNGATSLTTARRGIKLTSYGRVMLAGLPGLAHERVGRTSTTYFSSQLTGVNLRFTAVFTDQT